MPGFKLSVKQLNANALLADPLKRHLLLYGGSRSGKTFLLTRAICIRALKARASRHAIFRFRLGHVKTSVMLDTFPKVMSLCFPGISYDLNKSDMFATLPGDSEIWFSGLDDKERTEKVLGHEYATIYLNEASQIPWHSRNTVLTRLAQRVDQLVDGARSPLPLKEYVDENPPDKGHWTYRLFIEHKDPESKTELAHAERYGSLQVNPVDNLENIDPDYLDTLAQLPVRLQKRFLRGEFREANPNALFTDEVLDRWRVLDGALPEFVRVVVAVDPSGADDDDNERNDAIGIIVAALGTDGVCYILEDCTVLAGPATWGNVAVTAWERHGANAIVGEINFGGAMVNHVIQSARPRTPFRRVVASRGKVVRAEPVSALAEKGTVRLAGNFPQLEDELCSFTTHGFVGDRSPNRADAMIWAVSDLFPKLFAKRGDDKPVADAPKAPNPHGVVNALRSKNTSWMGQ